MILGGLMILIPSLGGALCLVAPRTRYVGLVCITCAVSGALLSIWIWLALPPGSSVTGHGSFFIIDSLSVLHTMVCNIFVVVPSTLFGFVYFGHEKKHGHFPRNVARRAGSLWLWAIAAMMLVLQSNNIGIMWVGVEASTLFTAFLICLHRTGPSLKATWKYLIICSVGVAFAFIGTLFVAAAAQSAGLHGADLFTWTKLREFAAQSDPKLLKTGFIFLLIGYGTKAGIAPMHNWLPDAHSQAPGPVSALFSGFLLSTSLFCIMRFLPIVTLTATNEGWVTLLLRCAGLLSILVAAAFMLVEKNTKRLLAYSSIEHMGVIVIGLTLGLAGIVAVLFHTVNHAIAKTTAFCAAGRLGQVFGSTEIADSHGALARAPLWGGALFVSLLALLGCAPFGPFFSELQVALAAVKSGSLWTLALFLCGLIFVFFAALKLLIALAWNTAPSGGAVAPRPTLLEVVLVVAPLTLLLMIGLWQPKPLTRLLADAAAIVGGGR